MKWTGLNELREMYLSFFEAKDHLRLPSFSLVPQGDKSLLLINAGMAPLKKYFTGESTPPAARVTTCQKCVRTPDIERVGKTSRHGTYFEMLGNFSFGDYFKDDAISWAWEFLTEVVKLPKEKLFISVYSEDEEAYNIWRDKIGIDPDYLVKLGKEDNFWELGAGPCGPCSEIYYDRGEEAGCGLPACKPGCDCDRYVELWNLVFTQFESDGAGNYKNLSKRNIDTGMGLERLACVIQGVDNLFEVDTVQNIMKHVIRLAGVEYKKNDNVDTSLRVITDHIRSTTFLIGDGVLPSNEGRGYVLRRLLRRAARHGRLLGIKDPFLAEICETVIQENKDVYHNLVEKRDFILKVITNEEENFGRTIDTGLQVLEEIISAPGLRKILGGVAFKLSDTYGFPLELTKEIAHEKGLTVDEEEYENLINQQRTNARNARKKSGDKGWEKAAELISALPATIIIDRENRSAESNIISIIENSSSVEKLQGGKKATLVLAESAFYPESGGQLGDTGTIENGDFVFCVEEVTKSTNDVILHHGTIINNQEASTGEKVVLKVDEERRNATKRNHTAAHLLHSALRTVVGKHVVQAGQEVGPKIMRFDFTHFSALTDDEIVKIENLINAVIMAALPVAVTEMPLEQAKSMGVTALFDSKYGKTVRVVKVGDFSAELCGGTHVENTGNIGLFKVISEFSVSSGVRRIEGITGTNLIEYLENIEISMKTTAGVLKITNTHEIEQRAASIINDLKLKEKEIENLKIKLSSYKADQLIKQAKTHGDIKLVTAVIEDSTPEDLRTLSDSIKVQQENMVVVLAGINEANDSVSFTATSAPDAIKAGIHAGRLVKEIAVLAGGSGGGRPDSAMAGSKNPALVHDAMDHVDEVVLKMLKL